MPRKAKDKEEVIEDTKAKKVSTKKPAAKKTAVKKVATKTTKKATTTKKTAPKKATTTAKKTTTATTKKTTTTKKPAEVKKKAAAKKTTTAKKPAEKKVATKKEPTVKKKTSTTKKSTAKATTKVAAKTTVKKTATKKEAVKKATTKAKTTAKKTTTSRKKKVEENLLVKPVEILEYYDLPYRYNETIVKVLAQTPNILFVYWDISDEDKEKYIKQYGEFFFNDTKPVLIVHNDTLGYSYEVDINDFASSWYLHVNDSNCDYRVELGRRPINEYAKINDYLYVSSSNDMNSPNDHILFDTISNNIYFKNVKTDEVTLKDISLYLLSRIGKLYNIREFYLRMYRDENIDFDRLNLRNMPSS